MNLLAVVVIWCVALTGVIGVTAGFARVYGGRLPAAGMTLLAGLLVLAAGLHDILSLLPPHQLLSHLMVYSFGLVFVLLDAGNHWLPLEFTAPFLVCGLVLAGLHSPAVLAYSLISAAVMAVLLGLFRLLMNRRYDQDTLGMGDVWMMTGLAAYFPFPVAASLLTVGLALMLTVALLRRSSALPLAPFVMPVALAYCQFRTHFHLWSFF